MSTAAPQGIRYSVTRNPVIVIDAFERPVLISPDLRVALGLRPEDPIPGSLREIMDDSSAQRVHFALLNRNAGDSGTLPIRLACRAAGFHDAAAEVLPTTGGGAVLVVSLPPGPWSTEDTSRFLEQSRDLVFSVLIHPAVTVRYVNAAFRSLTGHEPETFYNEPLRLLESVHPDDRTDVCSAFQTLERFESPVTFRFRHLNGEWRRLEVVATPTIDDGGRVVAVDGITRDITARARTDEQFHLFAERCPDMIFRVGLHPSLRTEYVNPACRAVTGWTADELNADPLVLLRHVHPDDRTILEEFWARPGESRDGPLRFRILDPHGNPRLIEQSVVPVNDDSSRLIAIEGVCRDITDQQAVEDSLRCMNRRIGLLSSITRHDILNQLTVLQGALELADMGEKDPELSWFLARSREAANLIQRLVEFTRDCQEVGQAGPAWLSIGATIRRAASSFAGEDVEIVVPEDGGEILAEPLIEKVFFTLIDNALRHGDGVETIRFRVEGLPDGTGLIVCQDDGSGVPADQKDRIFERGIGRNTGLGLYLAREILGIAGIKITETGEIGEGARFELRVPACAYRSPDRDRPRMHQAT
ncbi:MAG: PAS domain-containing protein [Methanospirillum sp.]|nr:PAS domain-containing protein [Methanospirillum sp.]